MRSRRDIPFAVLHCCRMSAQQLLWHTAAASAGPVTHTKLVPVPVLGLSIRTARGNGSNSSRDSHDT